MRGSIATAGTSIQQILTGVEGLATIFSGSGTGSSSAG